VEGLYGRADVLALARRGVEHALAGGGRLLLFTGEPGIGKSRLAEQVAAEAGERGAAVAWGRCWEAGGAPAYWPWVQVFRALELEDPFTGTAPQLGQAAEARFAVFDRAVAALRAAASKRPLALVLDDLHAADAPSLLLLLLLAHDLPRTPILVVGAYRAAEVQALPDIAPLLAQIAREAEVLPLGRLSSEAVATWVRETGADTSRAAELYRFTEGHPLFVVEAMRLASGRGVLETPALGLAAVLDERLRRLSPATRTVLEAAAVLGRDGSLVDLAATAGTTADQAFATMKEASAASILEPGAETGRFRFSHVLLRDRLYGELAPSARAALHHRAGLALLARGADAQVAVHHLFEGRSAGDPVTIARAALGAAEASLARLAFEDAARLGRRALDPPAETPGAPLPASLEAPLLLVVAEAAIRLGEPAEGKRLCLEAAVLAEQAGADQLLARAALVYGTELASGTIDPRMIDLLRKALGRLGEVDSPLRARVMVRLAAALTPTVDPAEGPEILKLARAALAMARQLGDRHTLLYVLQFSATVALLVPEDERFAVMQETVELARALDQRLALLLALPAYVTATIARGDLARAEAELPAYDQLLAEFRQPLHRERRLLIDSLMLTLRGDFEAAEAVSQQARALAQTSDAGPGMVLWLTHRLSLAQLRGRPDLLAELAEMLLAYFSSMRRAIPYVAWMLAGLGRHQGAAEQLRTDNLEPLSIPSANLMDLMGAAETCVLLDDRELAGTLYPRLLRAADRMFSNMGPGALLGPTARALGDLARLIGKSAEAARHYDDAIAFCEKLGSPPLVALCRERRAALDLPETPAASPAPAAISVDLRREAEIWTVTGAGGPVVRLRHSKGLGYLQYLIEQPGRQVHVLELSGVDYQTGDAGVVLDPRAKAEYRARLDALAEQLSEAEGFGDTTRASRIEQEIDALTEQLAGAVGLGGRDRRAASDVERLRINVQRRLKDAIDRIGASNPALGRYLGAAVKTGTYCLYQPF
jgi:hypothetical protein